MDFSSLQAQVLESFNQQQAAAASGLQRHGFFLLASASSRELQPATGRCRLRTTETWIFPPCKRKFSRASTSNRPLPPPDYRDMDFSSLQAQVLESFNQQQAAAAS